ncbi:transposase [Rhizobium leguminosarum]|uniref:transposase n=1 Tax=Rhizobium leguminosarum TaxID=384 RepID=UPI003F9C6557
MVDENSTGAIARTVTEGKAPVTKIRSPTTASESFETVSSASGAKSGTVRRSRFSAQERTKKLKLIEEQAAEGSSTLKEAIKRAGISEQTYYNWKRVWKTASVIDESTDVAQLEEENQRLRKILAEKLRAENAELRKRLGLD